MAHVAQLMGQHALQLIVVQEGQNAVGDGDRGVLGVAAGGEGVGRFGGNHVDLRHGNAGAARQTLYHRINARQLVARDRLRPVHAQRYLVGVEVAEEVHRRRHGKGQQCAAFAAKVLSGQNQNQRKSREENGRFEDVHLFSS